MFQAAECFHDSLIEIGVNEDSAETARKAFLSLKKNTMEETQNKIRKIASKISLKNGGRQYIITEETKDIVGSNEEL